ncbi:MAG TPA: YbaN family protein [Halomonas sp.]|nr:YbaN family protein [Halomonas sp.]
MRTIYRYLYLLLAALSFCLGVIGIFLPLMPTTVFMLVAVWAASRSSPEFAVWLREHRRFGPPIVAWENERAIPRHAKLLACLLLSISIAVIAFGDLAGWGKGLLLAGLAGIALWIMTRPEPSVRR